MRAWWGLVRLTLGGKGSWVKRVGVVETVEVSLVGWGGAAGQRAESGRRTADGGGGFASKAVFFKLE